MRRPRVALVSDWFLPRVGGIELHLGDLARELHKCDIDVHIITTTPGPDHYCGMRVHRLRASIMPGVGVASPNPWKVWVLRRVLLEQRVDLVHVHGMFSTLAICGILAAHFNRTPCVTTNHSLIRGVIRPLAKLVFAVVSHRADVVSAVSEAAAEDARAASGRDDVEILPNGIDPAAWSRAQPDDRRIDVVSVMRLTRKKAPGDLIRAIPEIVRRVPSVPPVFFTVVGDGPERPRLEKMVGELGLQNNVRLVGYQDRAAINRLMSRAALMLSPCPAEAFGIALLEARCVGLPVVAMNHGGTAEIVQHGRNGFLANDHREFVDCAVRVLSDASLRRELREGGAGGVDRFGWDRVIDRHLAVYRRAVELHARGARPLRGRVPAATDPGLPGAPDAPWSRVVASRRIDPQGRDHAPRSSEASPGCETLPGA